MKFLSNISNASSIYRRADVDSERQEADLKHDPRFLEMRPVQWVLGKINKVI
jgi:hypothetical protein